MNTQNLLVSTVLLLISGLNLNGQGCCSGGVPFSGNLNLSANEAKTLRLSLTYDSNLLNDVVIGSKEINDKTRSRIAQTLFVRADYTFSKRWAINLLTPFIIQTEKISFNNITNTARAGGIGDIVALAQYNVINKNLTKLSMAGGFKLPVGPTDKRNKNTGITLPIDMQPSTGAVDFILSGHYSKLNIFSTLISISTDVNYRHTHISTRYNGQQQYKLGNETQLSFSVFRPFIINDFNLTSDVSFRSILNDTDRQGEQKVSNTGGLRTDLSGGLDFSVSDNFRISSRLFLPLYRNLDGVQLTNSYRWTSSVFYTFYKKNDLNPKKVF